MSGHSVNLIPEKHELQNGLPIIFVPMQNNPNATVTIMVRGGSRHETEINNGIAHLREHGFFDGGVTYPDLASFAKILDGTGAKYNAYTTEEEVAYHIKLEASDTPIALDIMSDMFLCGQNRADDLKKNQNIVLQELNMRTGDPETNFWDSFYKQNRYGSHPLGLPIGGNSVSIKHITLDDTRNYCKDYYTPSNLCVILAGNPSSFSPATLRRLDETFGTMPNISPKQWKPFQEEQKVNRLHLISNNEVKSATVVLAIPCEGYRDTQHNTTQLVASLLGSGISSRLFLTIREKLQACYSIFTDVEAFEEVGTFQVVTRTEPGKTVASINAIIREINKMTHGYPPAEELEKIKNMIIKGARITTDNAMSVGISWAKQFLLYGKLQSLTERCEKIQSITEEQFFTKAQQLFSNPTQRELYIMHPADMVPDTDALQKILGA